MIRTNLTVSGVSFQDYRFLNLTRAISKNATTSFYDVTLDNPYGRHKTDFIVGNEVKIFADKDASPTTNIFTGIIDTITFQGEGLSERAILRGRDYSARLMDNTINTVVYSNFETGSIVNDVITDNLTDIGSANVGSTTVNIRRIAFNQIPIYEGIRQLALLSNHTFFVDNNKDLNFRPAGSIFTGTTLGSSNIISMTFDKTREGMANKIWVYGDRYFAAAPRELFAVGGTPGSVYTLQFQPHDTAVMTSNTTAGSNLKGGILNMNITNLTSGVDYLVNFFDRQIIFVSGTAIGYSTIPNANGSVIVNYNRDLPIIKYGEDRVSIATFGPKTEVTNDKSIKDPLTAQAIKDAKLALANPLNNITCNLRGWFTFSPGETVNVNVPDFDLVVSGLNVVEMNYAFTPETASSEEVISVKLDNREIDLTDEITDLRRRLDALEAGDRQTSDVFTRGEFAAGSFLIVGSYWALQPRWLGSEFRTWPTSNIPPIGSNFTPRLGILGSSTIVGAGSLSYLVATGFTFNPYQVKREGSYNY